MITNNSNHASLRSLPAISKIVHLANLLHCVFQDHAVAHGSLIAPLKSTSGAIAKRHKEATLNHCRSQPRIYCQRCARSYYTDELYTDLTLEALPGSEYKERYWGGTEIFRCYFFSGHLGSLTPNFSMCLG